MRRASFVAQWAVAAVTALFASTAPARAQSPSPSMERVTLDEAVKRALDKNPTIAEAAEAILRAEGLLQQVRATTMPSVRANFSNALYDSERGFSGAITQPRNQATFSAQASVPVLAASRWAATAQARDQVEVADLSTRDVRRQIGVATAETYLSVIALTHQIEVNQRARDSAQTHLEYAQRRLAAGAGTRLNELRAAQEVSADDARLDAARLAVRRAQEALGVLMAEDGPVDAAADPVFDTPTTPSPSIDPAWLTARTDIQFLTAAERASDRVWRDSSKDYFPTGAVSFDPQWVTPAGAFSPSRTWRLTVLFSQSVFDGGERRGLARVRQAAAQASKARLTSVEIQARSEVRMAEEAIRILESAWAHVRLSAEQANEVLRITNTAFEAGATTNLEVIDAQRTARDAESAEQIARDAVQRARLDLLTSLGRFPQ